MNAPNQMEAPRGERITNRAELEGRLLYSMVVAGKSAKFADAAMQRFWMARLDGETPFQMVWRMVSRGTLERNLRMARTGNYGKLCRGFDQMTRVLREVDLTKVEPQHLETISGVGPKTSRFFILWTRPDARHAAIDTHILKWLRFLGHPAPASTPSDRRHYARWETVVLAEADSRGLTPRQLDLQVWEWCQARKHLNGEWPAELHPR